MYFFQQRLQHRNILPTNHHRNHLAIRKQPPSKFVNSNSPQQFQKPFQDNSIPFLNVYDPYNNERSREFEQQQNEYLGLNHLLFLGSPSTHNYTFLIIP